MAVHHVDMDQIGAGVADGCDLLAKACKVGGQDGRRYKHVRHASG
jgi:hypothetical protein